ncbi:MAG TPA: helix-turn-helix transcriptional regulator [Opitutaceae bacterium]|jgi:transcriptional regulator with XRE-family HTH domain|nr:helix-turn-helix transcriptional regulator [Opitutaceae bacterium]
MKSPAHGERLKTLRKAANLSQRELAALIDETHTNVAYWETSGNLPRSDVLLPMAKALGVTLEELLGAPKPKHSGAPAGKARQLFEAVNKLPRRQQEKIFDILQPFVRDHLNEQKAS